MEGVLATQEPTSPGEAPTAPTDPPVQEKTLDRDAGQVMAQSDETSLLAKTGDLAQAERADATLPDAAATDDPHLEIHPHRLVEAILFAAESAMPPAKIAVLMGVGDAREVRKHVQKLNDEYDSHGFSFRIQEVAGGFQMLTLPAYNPWLKKLMRARQETRLSPAALETLAILAYKQPCTRADVEAIRGVAAGELINRLRELNLVKIVGRAEDLGRPLLYGTTKHFLEIFGLPSLEELPQVEALRGGNTDDTVRESATMQTAALANEVMDGRHAVEPMLDVPPAPVEAVAGAGRAMDDGGSAAPVAAPVENEPEQM